MKKLAVLFSLLLSAFLVSCSKDYEVLPSVDQIILTADSSTKLTGETITFTITNNFGENLTDEVEIFVDGTPISSNSYTSDLIGEHVVTASYFSVNASPLLINFHDGSEINFVKRLLIEDYTGTWCGYCPRVAHALEQLHNLTDAFVPVAIHRASSNVNSPSYDPYNYNTTQLENFINIPGYPKGMLNRTSLWTNPEPDHLGEAIDLTQGENPKLGLAMTSTVSGSNFDLTVNVKFAKNFTGLKLVVYVLENGLVHEQHNYTTYYNDEDVIPAFEHNHVLRLCLTPLLGEEVGDAETVLNNTFSKTFSLPFPTNIVDTSKVEFVAFIVDASGKAVNVRKAPLGDTQVMEEL